MMLPALYTHKTRWSSVSLVLFAALLLNASVPMLVAHARWGQPVSKTAAKPKPTPYFLPPISTMSAPLTERQWQAKYDPTALVNPAQRSGDAVSEAAPLTEAMETIELTDVVSPKIEPHARVLKLDNDLSPAREHQQVVAKHHHELTEADLKQLWEAAVEHNPVIRFAMEKLATPEELHQAKSSIFMRKTLNAMITGATMAAVMVPGGGAYQNMGLMAGGDVLRNVTQRGQGPVSTLTATEKIQLASLIDELQGRVIQTYSDYKTALLASIDAQDALAEKESAYQAAFQSGDALKKVLTASAYFKAQQQAQKLHQQALLYRLQLERLSGVEAVSELKLAALPDECAPMDSTPMTTLAQETDTEAKPTLLRAGVPKPVIKALPKSHPASTYLLPLFSDSSDSLIAPPQVFPCP